MVVFDVLIVLFLVVLVLKGYNRGFMRTFGSIFTAALGIGVALRKAYAVAPALNGLLHNETVARVMSFLFLLLLFWLALRLCRKLLTKLVDWSRLLDFDQYAGGILGLCRGVALVWAALALCLTLVPSSYRFIEQSPASVRILTIGENIIGNSFQPDEPEPSADEAARDGTYEDIDP
jgi:membrane protein required for colicin V production